MLLQNGFAFCYPAIGEEQLNVNTISKVFSLLKIEIQSFSHTQKTKIWLIFSMHGWHINGMHCMETCVDLRQERNVGEQQNSHI